MPHNIVRPLGKPIQMEKKFREIGEFLCENCANFVKSNDSVNPTSGIIDFTEFLVKKSVISTVW